ncbi:hypothetical protein BC332_09834 [Capsicum chinense]|nr:hypothetical protein BC332_09834 [Capsicum chinense]
MGLHGKSTSSRSLLTAGGGTTRNVADRSVQHRKLFVIGWKQLLFAVANTKEVDKYYDLPNILEKAGYLGAYKRRTGSSVDGCALFWKVDKFQLLEGESIELRQLMGSASDERMLEIWIIGWLRSGAFDLSDIKKHVSIYSELDVSPDFQGTDICVKPSQGDSYLGTFMCYIFQAAEMLSLVKLDLGFLSICSSLGGQSYLVPVAGGKWQAHILSEKWDHVPIVLAGDYNSTPQSPIYKFLSSSELNLMLRNRKELSGQRRCHPSQVLGLRRERGSLFVLMDRRIILEEDGTNFRVLTEKISEE